MSIQITYKQKTLSKFLTRSTVDEMVEHIRSDAPKDATLKHRELKGTAGYDDEFKQKHMRQYFLLNFRDLKEGSSSDNVFVPTGLMSFDIDIYSNEEQAAARAVLFEKLSDFILVCFKSPSGGLKFIIQTDYIGTSKHAFKHVYKKIQEEIKVKTDLRTEFDSKTCNISRGVVASWDPDCYYNPDAAAIDTSGMLDDFDEHLADIKSMVPETDGMLKVGLELYVPVMKRIVKAMSKGKIKQHTGKYIICCSVRKYGGNREDAHKMLGIVAVNNLWFELFDIKGYVDSVWDDIIQSTANDPSLLHCGFTDEQERAIKDKELRAIFNLPEPV